MVAYNKRHNAVPGLVRILLKLGRPFRYAEVERDGMLTEFNAAYDSAWISIAAEPDWYDLTDDGRRVVPGYFEQREMSIADNPRPTPEK